MVKEKNSAMQQGRHHDNYEPNLRETLMKSKKGRQY